jgi:hypothetical protein
MNARSIPLLFGSCMIALFLVSIASAQAQRTFVSGLGSDANPCSRTSPCRTFGQAISQTNAGGEVIVLDSAGYGPFTVSTSVSIIAPPGVYAGISVFSGDGIDVNASGPDVVILRGLTINSQGGSSGITFTSGKALHVENCEVNGFQGPGIVSSSTGSLFITDSILRGNADGIAVNGSSNSGVSIDHVRLEGNTGFGLLVDTGKVSLADSVISGSNTNLQAVSNGTVTDVNVENCVVANSSTGVAIFVNALGGGSTTLRLSNSTVTDNQIGLWQHSPALLLSRGNNTVEGNGTNTMGTIGSYTAK